MIFVVAGLLIVSITGIDELRTTVGAAGAGSGPLSRGVFRAVWAAGTKLRAERFPPVRWVGGMGTVVIACTILSWLVLFWLGWTLVLLGSRQAVLTAGNTTASFAGRVFYAGTSLADLGNAAFRATQTGYQLGVVGEAFTGLVLLGLAITFVSPVTSAVVDARNFASQVAALGSDPAELVGSLGDCGTGVASQQLLVSLSSQLSQIAQQHRAYPLLVTFRGRSSQTAVPLAVANLLDAVLVLAGALPEEARLSPSLTKAVLSAVEAYVAGSPTRVGRPSDPPPFPDIPDVPATAAAAACSGSAELRTSTLRVLLSSGWSWPGLASAP